MLKCGACKRLKRELFFFFQAEDGIRDIGVTGVQTCALPISFVLTGEGIPRQGNPVIGGGEVTSGTLSPMLGIGIGMAYLPSDRTAPGTRFEKIGRASCRERV